MKNEQHTRHMAKGLLPLCLLLALPMSLKAQVEVDADPVDQDEIIVTDEQGNKEEVEFPEAMTYNLDSLMNQYMSKTYLMVDNDCQTTDVNPEYSVDEYIDRLQRMPTIMEMPYNEVVRSCIDRYTVRLRRSVSYMLGAANFYMPIFEEALDTYQLPLELKYLPVIESALNPVAVSRVGATGLWQFMLPTGKAYGLNVNSLVDDRRDPLKASYAAARYLRDLYNLFGDWNLVIAAYNCGPENINKAIRRAGGERDYWKIYPYLPKETRGYVPAFIAANYVMTYYCEHNICPLRTQLPVKTDTVVVHENLSFEQIANVCGLDIDMIRSLNPAYRRDIVPGASSPSVLRLPVGDMPRFIDLQDSIIATQQPLKRAQVEITEPNIGKTKKGTKGGKNAAGAKWVTVRRGDTLSSIARRNHTTVNAIKRLNGLRGNNIRAGQKLRVK